MAKSPTARTLEVLRSDGWLAQAVEHWNPHASIRMDLFGFIDVLAVCEGRILGIQACAVSSQAKRIAKIVAHRNLPAVLRSGMEVEVWAWKKYAKPAEGERARWRVTITPIIREGK